MAGEIVLITGANSGLGLLTAERLAKNGFIVIAAVRNPANSTAITDFFTERNTPLRNMIIKTLDVTDPAEVKAIYHFIKDTYGRLDILINNAGFSQGGVVEAVQTEQWHEQFNVNVFGLVSLTRTFIPMMREARKGKIINMGSISGKAGFPGLAPYAASKHALEGFSESLRLELKPFNVSVSIIEGAAFKTDIWKKGIAGAAVTSVSDYRKLMAGVTEHAEKQAENAENPEKLISLIYGICCTRMPRFRYRTGKNLTWFLMIKSLLPWRVYESAVLRFFAQKK